MAKPKKNKKLIVIITIFIVLAAVVSIAFAFSPKKSAGSVVNGYTKLSKTELTNSISASGNVKSKTSRNVYSSLNYSVKSIHVSVGDHVAAGAVLAELDTESLKLDIAQQRSTLNNSQRTTAIDLENKRLTFDNSKSQYEGGTNSELINAESTVKTAKSDLDTKTTNYENNKNLFNLNSISKQTLDQSETDYKLASDAYEKALKALNTTKTKIEQDMKSSEANLKTAEANLSNDSQLIALQKLEKNLADATIKSPIEGTVTAIYAKEGSPGNGLMFVVEDTKNIIVTAYIKEYDSVKVHTGQLVTIKSDNIGDKVLNGKVTKISPTSTKDDSGKTETSSTVEFETEVSVLDQDTQLKIGMNVRLSILLDKKSDVFAVPCDAVTTNSSGKDVIYTIIDKDGKKVVKELEVHKGLETDLYTEVSGDGISNGVTVVNDASSVKPGSIVILQALTK